MMRSTLLAAACGLAFVSSTANAAVTVDDTSFDTYDIANPNGPFTTISYGDAGLGNNFSEFLTFTNTLGGLYNIDASTSSPFTDFTSGVLTFGGNTVATLMPVVEGDTKYFRTTNVALGAGQYTLTLQGLVDNPQAPGVLAGTVSIRQLVSGAPEPATWAMMLLGFGMVGFSLRRRQATRVRYNFAAA